MLRLENVAVKGGKSASLVMPRACVCGSGSSEPECPAQSVGVATCPDCGGSLPKALEATRPERPERPERRHLQDFLSAFV